MSVPLEARRAGSANGGPSFSLTNRLARVLWGAAWLILARWTPPPLHRWRAMILRSFGAKIGAGTRVYASAKIWLPSNLVIGEHSTIGPRVRVYNQGFITIGARTTISQDTTLCASSHDFTDPHFQLVLRPITIEDNVWIAAEAFVSPGTTVRGGAVLGARGVAVGELSGWTVHAGHPARPLKSRTFRD